jgi:pyrimidine operon attenuation protein/uracil phosphoribosyltransferase
VKPRKERRPPPDDDLVERREILDAAGVTQALERIADAVAARNRGEALALVGVRTGGLYLAERLARALEPKVGKLPVGAVDIALYRDDVFVGLPRPEIGPTEIPFPLAGRTIVLVDDVLFTGRTVRAALDALVDFGRPHAVQLAVLVDRGHRELPIAADYVGVAVETMRGESVRVMLQERGEPDRVVVRERRAT